MAWNINLKYTAPTGIEFEEHRKVLMSSSKSLSLMYIKEWTTKNKIRNDQQKIYKYNINSTKKFG